MKQIPIHRIRYQHRIISVFFNHVQWGSNGWAATVREAIAAIEAELIVASHDDTLYETIWYRGNLTRWDVVHYNTVGASPKQRIKARKASYHEASPLQGQGSRRKPTDCIARRSR